ncbi:transposase [Propionibacterium phage Anatole]|uniref:Transposase n=4 Tax=Caudoviricetes TaxID=2731619 RepID=A0A1D8ETB5_9CAUD|nr:transposase [Propionibacterium phage Anatole]YP_009596916.1 transposase [Propionibacterium phage B3]AOT24288.1 transposase [Propionibacterium phage Anatole]AOT24345.1 transposase [Propionibacterium phage B3]AOT24524.1 transposase [Propionibacterium phage E1]
MAGMQETVRYNYRLRPGATAERALLEEWHRCRFLWNEAVHQSRTGRKPTFAKLSKLLTEARSRTVWLREGSQDAQQQMLRTYAQALDHSFKVKGCGRPQAKKRKNCLPSLAYSRNGFAIKEGRLRLPKGVTIPVVWSRELPSDPTSVQVYQDSLGHWYASFVVRREIEPLPEVDGGIGIDWGVSTTATTTDPAYDLPHVGARKAAAADLVKAQRKMARRRRPKGQPQTKGYQRAKLEAAKVAKKAQRRNTHEGRMWARRVVADHQLIAVEDFRPKFLAKSTMAKKAADAAVSTIKRTLIEYAERAGRKVVLVQPAYTTMTCSGCGTRAKDRLLLDERTFVCTHCGLIADRDVNAARTILAVAERGHTSVESVRHSEPPFEVSGAA